jgi:hypothetical protein
MSRQYVVQLWMPSNTVLMSRINVHWQQYEKAESSRLPRTLLHPTRPKRTPSGNRHLLAWLALNRVLNRMQRILGRNTVTLKELKPSLQHTDREFPSRPNLPRNLDLDVLLTIAVGADSITS